MIQMKSDPIVVSVVVSFDLFVSERVCCFPAILKHRNWLPNVFSCCVVLDSRFYREISRCHLLDCYFGCYLLDRRTEWFIF